jgi:hypothetical protein
METVYVAYRRVLAIHCMHEDLHARCHQLDARLSAASAFTTFVW